MVHAQMVNKLVFDIVICRKAKKEEFCTKACVCQNYVVLLQSEKGKLPA